MKIGKLEISRSFFGLESLFILLIKKESVYSI